MFLTLLFFSWMGEDDVFIFSWTGEDDVFIFFISESSLEFGEASPDSSVSSAFLFLMCFLAAQSTEKNDIFKSQGCDISIKKKYWLMSAKHESLQALSIKACEHKSLRAWNLPSAKPVHIHLSLFLKSLLCNLGGSIWFQRLMNLILVNKTINLFVKFPFIYSPAFHLFGTISNPNLNQSLACWLGSQSLPDCKGLPPKS